VTTNVQVEIKDVMQLLRQTQDQLTAERMANIALSRQLQGLLAEHALCIGNIKVAETPDKGREDNNGNSRSGRTIHCPS